ARREENARLIRLQKKEVERLEGRYLKLDIAKRFKKAELDSQRSLYDGMIDRDEEREARTYVNEVIVQSEKELLDLTRQFEQVARERERARFLLAELE